MRGQSLVISLDNLLIKPVHVLRSKRWLLRSHLINNTTSWPNIRSKNSKSPICLNLTLNHRVCPSKLRGRHNKEFLSVCTTILFWQLWIHSYPQFSPNHLYTWKYSHFSCLDDKSWGHAELSSLLSSFIFSSLSRKVLPESNSSIFLFRRCRLPFSYIGKFFETNHHHLRVP